jgi:hypothetical protein
MTPTPIPGDANCDHRVDAVDVSATYDAIFDLAAQASCDADCNRDGDVTSADFICVIKAIVAE